MPIDTRELKAQWETFHKDAVLDVLVPNSNGPEASDIAKLSIAETNRLTSRQFLFFDEIAVLQIVLRSEQALQTVEEWLPYLELSVTAHATNASADGSNNFNPATTKHDIGVQRLLGPDNAAIQAVGRASHIVWRTTVHITRPRARLQRPAIYFTAHLGLSTKTIELLSKSEPVYVPSYEPLPANVLEPLRFAPGLAGSEIFLSEQRITKVAPVIQQHDNAPKSLRGATKRAFPAMAVLFPQLRCASTPGICLADLLVEASGLLTCAISIEKAEIKIADHVADRLKSIVLPQLLQPGDQLGLLFTLRSNADSGLMVKQKEDTMTAHIAISAKAVLDADNGAELDIRWQVPIDVTRADTTFHHNWSETSKEHINEQESHTIQSSTTAGTAANGEKGTITFNFAAPKTVTLGTVFAMQVQCVNRSDRSRNFAVSPHSDTGSVLINTPKVSLGPVSAGACCEANIIFTAKHVGVLHFGGFRIFDMDTGRAIYVEDVPDVIAIEPGAQG